MYGKIATVILKRISINVLTEPGKIFKFLIYVILSILFILILPGIILMSLPLLLFSSPSAENTQVNTIAIYKEIPNKIENNVNEWIQEKKNEYSWCDDIEVNYSFNLTWKNILAIDTVILKQDFTNVTKEHIINIGNKFIIKKFNTKDYQKKEEYYDKVSKTTKTKLITKTKAIITISTKKFDEVVNDFEFSEDEIIIVKNIYKNLTEE